MINKITFIEKNDNTIADLDVVVSSMGEKQINIYKLQKHGYFIIDPGLISTAFCESKITYIDGKNGILLYRGFPIDQLTKSSTYLEVCYILLYGDIPTCEEYKNFCNIISKFSNVKKRIKYILHSFHHQSHPMVMLSNMVNSLSVLYNYLDINIKEHRNIIAYQLIAKMPIIAAMCYRYFTKRKFIPPQNHFSYVKNFLNMLFPRKNDKKNNSVHSILEQAMDRILILHADHEQNVSTSTVRIVGSSGVHPFSCIAAGIISLWGTSHGGANEACLHMLRMINKVENIPDFIKKVKDKHNPLRLIGFGHRVYKSYDPRAAIMRQTCHEVLKLVKVSDELSNLLSIAIELENIALNDQYFIERKLYPNIDFYSGLTLYAMGIPSIMFTVIFAVARSVGWIAHWREMYESENGVKLIRPRQLYKGHTQREFSSQISL